MARKTPIPHNDPNDARHVALDKALGDITKRYGENTVMRLGEAHQMMTLV